MKKIHYYITLPVLFFGFLLLFYFIGSNIFGLSNYKTYIPVIKNEKKLDLTSEKIIDIKKFYNNDVLGFGLAILTKKEIIFLDNDYKKFFSFKFSDFGININPTGFGFDRLGKIYVISDYKYIYTFIGEKKDNNITYKLKKRPYYSKDNIRYNPALLPDGAGNNGYHCAFLGEPGKIAKNVGFNKILDIVSPNINYFNKDYIVADLLVLDIGHKKVFKCNDGIGPSNEGDKKFKYNYNIENPRYLTKDFYVYSTSGNFENLQTQRKGKINNIGRIFDTFIIDRFCSEEIYKKSRYRCLGNEKYFDILNKKFNKQVKYVFYERHMDDYYTRNINSYLWEGGDAKEFDSLVVYKAENDLYKVHFDLKSKVDILYCVDMFLKYSLYLLAFYIIFVYIYLFNYFKKEKTNFVFLKYLSITSIVIIISGLILLHIVCIGVSGQGAIGCFFLILAIGGVLILNFIISAIIGYILRRKKGIINKNSINNKIEL